MKLGLIFSFAFALLQSFLGCTLLFRCTGGIFKSIIYQLSNLKPERKVLPADYSDYADLDEKITKDEGFKGWSAEQFYMF